MRSWIERRPLLSFSIASVALLVALYHKILDAPFVYDDLDQIVNNPALQSWHQLFTRFILSPVSFTNGFLGNGGTTYRPLVWITFGLDQHLWGSNAAGFHFSNVLLHWLNGLLLFTLLRRLNLSTLVAGTASLIWLGLPIQSEAIAWISARAYPLSTMFLLLAALYGLAYLRGKHVAPLVLFFVCECLASFSHEQGGLFIAYLAIAYILGLEKQSAKRWRDLACAALLADAIYFTVRHAVGSHSGKGSSAIWSVGEVFWKYVQLVVVPIHMSIERSTGVPNNEASIRTLVAWAALIGTVLIGIALRNRHRNITAALGCLLIGLVPYCGFVFIYQGMAERFTYIASMSLVLVALFLTALLRPMNQTFAFALLGIWVLWGGWRLLSRVEDWRQPEALYRHSLEATPRSAFLQDNLGVILRDAGNQEGALAAFQEAVQLRPDSASDITAIGDIHAAEGHPQQALDDYRRSLLIQPDDVKTVLNYAAALQITNHRVEAEGQYKRVLSLLPRDSAAYVDLETLYIEEGRLDDAIQMYKQATAINPDDANAYFNLGVMFQQRGQDREALAFYRKVLQLKPGDPTTLLYLSKLQSVQQQ